MGARLPEAAAAEEVGFEGANGDHRGTESDDADADAEGEEEHTLIADAGDESERGDPWKESRGIRSRSKLFQCDV